MRNFLTPMKSRPMRNFKNIFVIRGLYVLMKSLLRDKKTKVWLLSDSVIDRM